MHVTTNYVAYEVDTEFYGSCPDFINPFINYALMLVDARYLFLVLQPCSHTMQPISILCSSLRGHFRFLLDYYLSVHQEMESTWKRFYSPQFSRWNLWVKHHQNRIHVSQGWRFNCRFTFEIDNHFHPQIFHVSPLNVLPNFRLHLTNRFSPLPYLCFCFALQNP